MSLTHILNTLNAASALWALGGAGVVGVAAQLLKKVFGLNSTKVIQFLVISLGFVVTGLQYVLSSHNIPPTVLGLHTAVLVGLAQPLYVYVIKPFDNFMLQVKSYNASNQPSPSTTTSDLAAQATTSQSEATTTPPPATF